MFDDFDTKCQLDESEDIDYFRFGRTSIMNKKIWKKSGDELQGFLMWRNRGSVVPAKRVKALTRERVSIK